jgi:hypothetical protein
LALLHYPVVDRGGQVVTAAITNIDLHDISRSSLTFGLEDFFVVHPIEAQRQLAQRIRGHWVEGSGARRIPDRKPALSILRIVSNYEAALADLGEDAEIWTTSARPAPDKRVDFERARAQLAADGPPVLLCFGTGWGLAPEVYDRATCHLQPIHSPRVDGYNHLSVRAAAAIILDRLFGV